jgi:hypothetical protein
MTRWLAVGAALVSIGAISLVLRWGTSGRAGTPAFESAVLVLGIATPLASLLLSWHLWRQGRRVGALLSGTPLVLMAAGSVFSLSGGTLPLPTLLWLDLYVLLAFVVVLSRFGGGLLRPPERARAATTTSDRPSAA